MENLEQCSNGSRVPYSTQDRKVKSSPKRTARAAALDGSEKSWFNDIVNFAMGKNLNHFKDVTIIFLNWSDFDEIFVLY